ncbi:MAG: DUF4007 family protein [Sulfurospirillum sp.]|nr:DUF4007 family protein [Sulfurospirillum sp.]
MGKIKTSFSGHDKFDCKIDWVTKALKAYKEDNTIFLPSNVESSISKLGLGVNMIKSLNHWMKAIGLIDNNNLTELGNIILEKDPFFENNNTIWLLHWNLVKKIETATLYNLYFNKFYFNKFTKQELLEQLIHWVQKHNINISPTTLKSDIEVFLKMYTFNNKNNITMSLFSDLRILSKHNDIYNLNINNTASFSDDVFLYVLNDYLEIKYPNGIHSISIDDIQRGTISIQKSLCMHENLLFSKIHNLNSLTDNKMSYSEAAGIKQIYIVEQLSKAELLKKIYS